MHFSLLRRWNSGVLAVIGAVFLFAGCDKPSGNSSTTASTQTTASQPEGSRSPEHSKPSLQLRQDLIPIFIEIRDHRTGPARVKLRNILKLKPDDGQAAFLFGMSYHREKRYGEAQPWFEQALKHAPEYAVTHYFYGWALYYLGQPEQAREHFEAFRRVNPDEHDTHFALGIIALDANELAAAQDMLQRSIDLHAKNGSDDLAALSRAHARLGEVYEREDRLEDARREIERAVELFPDHYEAMYRLYRVLVKLGEIDKAKAMHERYIETRERIRPGTAFPE